MLTQQPCTCPYCGETFETTIDLSAGTQTYIEDCYVCCRPIEFSIEMDIMGALSTIHLSRDDE